MSRYWITTDLATKVATLTVGCGVVSFGLLGTAGAVIATAAAPLLASLSIPVLERLIASDPRCVEAFKATQRKVSHEFRSQEEATDANLKAAVRDFDRILDADDLFGIDAVRNALDGRDTELALTEALLGRLVEKDPGFAEGLKHDLAETVLTRAFGIAFETCAQFRNRLSLSYDERTLGVVLDIRADAADMRADVARIAEAVNALPDVLEEIVRRALSDQTVAVMTADLQATVKSAAREELSELPTVSNIAPEAGGHRSEAKAAMARNDIAGALRHMQLADQLEAEAEADALRRLDQRQLEAREAREAADVQVLSRARSLAAYASLTLGSGDFDRGIVLYREAIRRLPAQEVERQNRYRSGLRRALNRKAASLMRTGTPFPYGDMRSLLLGDAEAAGPDIFSFNVLTARAPDYAEARALFSEMKAAKVAPDVFTFSSLVAQAPNYAEARAVFVEMRAAQIDPNVVTFSTLIAQAPDYGEARAVFAEMRAAQVVPNIVTFGTLIAQAPDYAEARAVLQEMRAAGVTPDVISFNTLMAKAPDYAGMRAVLAELKAAGETPNAISFNTLMARAPDYPEAQAVLTEMGAAGVRPDVISFSTLMAQAPDSAEARKVMAGMRAAGVTPNVVTFSTLVAHTADYDDAMAVLAEMKAADVTPNAFTASMVGGRVSSLAQATQARDILRATHSAGNSFYEAVFKKLCPVHGAEEILGWAFGDPKLLPFPALGAAIASYKRQRRLEDAFRIASAFPHLEASDALFRDHGEAAIRYLKARYDGDREPHHAAAALGHCHLAMNAPDEARVWMETAARHPRTTEARRRNIEKLIAARWPAAGEPAPGS